MLLASYETRGQSSEMFKEWKKTAGNLKFYTYINWGLSLEKQKLIEFITSKHATQEILKKFVGKVNKIFKKW